MVGDILDTDPGSAGTPSTHVETLDASELAGTKTVTETVPAGWSLTNVDCTGVNETAITNGASFTVSAGDTIVCTFTNTKDATVRYTKVTDPASDPQDFTFGVTGTGMVGDILDTDPGSAGTPSTHVETLDASELAGTKTVTETVPAGWSLTNVDCTGVTRDGHHQWRQLHGQRRRHDRLHVHQHQGRDRRYTKVTDPASDPQDFTFGVTGTGMVGDLLDTDPGSAGTPSTHVETLDASELAGTKTVTETVPAGWSLTNVDCTGVNETAITNGASFTVSAGEHDRLHVHQHQGRDRPLHQGHRPGQRSPGLHLRGDRHGQVGDILDTDPGSAGTPSTTSRRSTPASWPAPRPSPRPSRPAGR